MGLSNEGKIVVKNHSFRVVGAVQMDYINVNLGVPESSAPGETCGISWQLQGHHSMLNTPGTPLH